MKTDILKKLIKDAVKEAIQEELKEVLLEAVRGNKQPITESTNRTLSFNTNMIPHQQPTKPNMDTKKAYMDILGEMAQGPKSGFDGDFKVAGPIDPVNGALPEGQLGLDQIMGLLK
jgi:hypothetical protein